MTKCSVEMKDYAQSQCFNGLSLRFTLYHSAHRESSLLVLIVCTITVLDHTTFNVLNK